MARWRSDEVTRWRSGLMAKWRCGKIVGLNTRRRMKHIENRGKNIASNDMKKGRKDKKNRQELLVHLTER